MHLNLKNNKSILIPMMPLGTEHITPSITTINMRIDPIVIIEPPAPIKASGALKTSIKTEATSRRPSAQEETPGNTAKDSNIDGALTITTSKSTRDTSRSSTISRKSTLGGRKQSRRGKERGTLRETRDRKRL